MLLSVKTTKTPASSALSMVLLILVPPGFNAMILLN